MPKLLRLLTLLTVLHLFILTLLRVSFWQYFAEPSDSMASHELTQAFYLGLKYDLRLALIMILPAFLFAGIRFLSPFRSNIARFLWICYFLLVMLMVLLLYSGNFGNYAYLGKSMDVTLLRFFDNPMISANMVWQTYPVLIWGFALLLLLVIYSTMLNRMILRDTYLLDIELSRWKKFAYASLSICIVVLGLYGKISYYPLRWSDAFFSPHPFVASVASNPVLYFLNTLKNRTVTITQHDASKHYKLMSQYLKISKPNTESLNYRRDISAQSATKWSLKGSNHNVVLVFMESFSAYKFGLFGNPLNPTPNLDALAKQGYLFTRFYTPSTGTARSVFTALTGLPDVEHAKTSTRNPLIVDQHTILNAFKDHEKFYFLGGSASWGNIRGLLSHNIPNLHLYEEGSYNSPRVDVWGISDYHLFKEANKVLARKRDKAFFAIIQTSGNHRPYTIPTDASGFVRDDNNDAKLSKSGFLNNGEYNSFRFLDYSIGQFIKAAKKQDYFDNTLFIFFGDHGVPGTGDHISPAYQQLELMNIHVPLIFYAPKLITSPAEFNFVASEVDLLPSIAGLLNTPYVNTTLGRDLFDKRYNTMRYAFTYTNGKPNKIGLINDQFYFQMNENGTNEKLHSLTSQTPRTDVSAQHRKTRKTMQQLLQAINITVNYMRFHNKQVKSQTANIKSR